MSKQRAQFLTRKGIPYEEGPMTGDYIKECYDIHTGGIMMSTKSTRIQNIHRRPYLQSRMEAVERNLIHQ